MQQNHVPISRKLLLKNNSEIDLLNVNVQIAVIPELTDKMERIINVIPQNSVVEVNNLPINISATYLSEITERLAGEIIVSVYSDKELITSEKYPIDILPFDQWGGLSVIPEMLSAFVTPNYPAITKVIHRASHFLETWTGIPSLDAYQSKNPDRVKKQIAAIYEAIAELNIVYCEPPASYEQSGQRIRLCDTIFTNKVGTCLDMSLLYASCIEAVGLNPIIIMVKGHAFAGAWLVDDTFSDSVNDDVSLLTKRIAAGINEIIMVETTCMNSGSKCTFDAAVSSAESKLVDSSNFILSIDVKRSRFAGIRPLPLRTFGENGIEIIEAATEYRNNGTPETITPDTIIFNSGQIEVTKQRLWERKLLDLSLRNNLLNIKLTKNTMQLISVNICNLEDALADGQEFQVLAKPTDWSNNMMDAGIYQSLNQTDPMMDLVNKELTQKRLRSYLTDSELTASMTHLYRSSRLSMEENGANTLYLALGLLKWYETPQSELPRYAPILLLPVELIRKSAQKGFVIRTREEEVMMNITLLEMLRQDFGIEIGGLENLPKDQSGVDVKLVFNTIRKGIMNQTKWNVEEQSILGIFSFSKFIMWNDIHSNAEKLYQNKIVKSLVSGKLEWDVMEEPIVNLDADLKPSDIVLPISADSFQLEAISEASKGRSFILHGPPGTGKSQTITNIIVDSIYKGKKVLFVAEKMAALSVVQKRLQAIGVDPFCLELHSNKSKKSTVLAQLKARTEVIGRLSPTEYLAESERLHTLRSELSKYVEVLHHKQAWGSSLNDALFGYHSQESISCDFEFSPELANKLTAENILMWRDRIEELQATAILCTNIADHPLLGLDFSQYTQSIKAEAKELFIPYVASLEGCRETVSACLQVFSKEIDCTSKAQFETLNELADFFLSNPTLSGSLLKATNLKEAVNQVALIVPVGLSRDLHRNTLLAQFNKNILAIDAPMLLAEWEIAEDKWFLPKYLEQNKTVKFLKAYSLNNKLNKSKVIEVITTIIAYQKEQQTIDQKNGYFTQLLGLMWNDGEGNWSQLEELCKSSLWLNDQLQLFTGNLVKGEKLRQSIGDELAVGLDSFLAIHQIALSEYNRAFKTVMDQYADLSVRFEIRDRNTPDESWIEYSLRKTNDWLANIDLLRDWSSWNTARKRAVEAGLNSWTDYLCCHSVDSNQIISAFDKALYKSMIGRIIDAEPVLASFNGSLFEDKIRKFRKMTLDFEKLTREELFARLASNVPSLVREAAQGSEVGILQRNIRNNGRGTSIRKLFDTIPALLTRLTPCMLMSPMSVAQYIDIDNFKFDLVIFDEASQMPTCEAIGAIARGHEVIVVGDPKQMPPTSFFSSVNVDEDNMDKEDLESILDDCLALSMPSKHLLWHYRSKHESLIAFSNSQYYENKLLTFPSPDDIQSKVTYTQVEGYYDKGKSRQNKFEAQAIVNEIIVRLSDKKKVKRSIGVVTFSSVQQSLIEDMLNVAYAQNPAIEAIALESAEPLFIKNLENVQGDERDVILFSVGYGPDIEGKVSLNFGPLNREGGWRRLNVAVSRARYEMKIFSTLRAEQIDLARTSSEGVAGLKAFLEYAEKGKNVIPILTGSQLIRQKSLVDIIADKIREHGFQVNTNIGCSGYRMDIVIVNPEKTSEYILGILCDGANYKAAKTVRDREIIQQEVLKTLGWKIYRVWTMDWWENQAKVMEGILNAITTSKSQVMDDNVAKSELLPPHNQNAEWFRESLALNKYVSPVESKYCIYCESTDLKIVEFPSEEFLNPTKSSIVLAQIMQVVNVEGPISRDQLCRKVLFSWGLSHIGSRINRYFGQLLMELNLESTVSGDKSFIWKPQQVPSKYMSYRLNDLNAEDISAEELSVAVKEILEQQISLTKEDLAREMARLFGFKRAGEKVSTAMNRGIEMAIQRGFAKEDRGRIAVQD